MPTNQPTVGVSPADAEYVLPAPPRPAGEVVVVAPRRELQPALRRGSDVARAIGDRLVPLVDGHAMFTAELRERLQALDTATADASRAQLKGAIRDVLAVLDWADAAQQDLAREARLAAGGVHPIDIGELCQDVAHVVQTADQPVIVQGHSGRPFHGSAPALAELVAAALTLVAERGSGNGVRVVQIGCVEGGVELRVRAAGEVSDGVEADTVARFRRAVAAVGATVRPDALGFGSTGFVIQLPNAAD
jgi:hypothetical protein